MEVRAKLSASLGLKLPEGISGHRVQVVALQSLRFLSARQMDAEAASARAVEGHPVGQSTSTARSLWRARSGPPGTLSTRSQSLSPAISGWLVPLPLARFHHLQVVLALALSHCTILLSTYWQPLITWGWGSDVDKSARRLRTLVNTNETTHRIHVTSPDTTMDSLISQDLKELKELKLLAEGYGWKDDDPRYIHQAEGPTNEELHVREVGRQEEGVVDNSCLHHRIHPSTCATLPAVPPNTSAARTLCRGCRGSKWRARGTAQL